MAYGSDNFTVDGALETSIEQGKTQMAVQSLAMTELQKGDGIKCAESDSRRDHIHSGSQLESRGGQQTPGEGKQKKEVL